MFPSLLPPPTSFQSTFLLVNLLPSSSTFLPPPSCHLLFLLPPVDLPPFSVLSTFLPTRRTCALLPLVDLPSHRPSTLLVELPPSSVLSTFHPIDLTPSSFSEYSPSSLRQPSSSSISSTFLPPNPPPSRRPSSLLQPSTFLPPPSQSPSSLLPPVNLPPMSTFLPPPACQPPTSSLLSTFLFVSPVDSSPPFFLPSKARNFTPPFASSYFVLCLFCPRARCYRVFFTPSPLPPHPSFLAPPYLSDLPPSPSSSSLLFPLPSCPRALPRSLSSSSLSSCPPSLNFTKGERGVERRGMGGRGVRRVEGHRKVVTRGWNIEK